MPQEGDLPPPRHAAAAASPGQGKAARPLPASTPGGKAEPPKPAHERFSAVLRAGACWQPGGRAPREQGASQFGISGPGKDRSRSSSARAISEKQNLVLCCQTPLTPGMEAAAETAVLEPERAVSQESLPICSFSGAIRNPPGHKPVQPALAGGCTRCSPEAPPKPSHSVGSVLSPVFHRVTLEPAGSPCFAIKTQEAGR